MMSEVHVRGYAMVYEAAERVGAGLECFARGAFSSTLRAPYTAAGIYLTLDRHDASPMRVPLTLFSDSYGLGFGAVLSDGVWRHVGAAVVAGYGCSVQFDALEAMKAELEDGTPCARVLRARLAHITLTDQPFYRNTAVWLAPTSLIAGDRLPPRLAALNARWERGLATWDLVEGFRRSGQARRDQASRDSRVADTACPWPVARAISPDAYLAGRAPAYREMRRAAELAACRGEGLVMAHAAFTARAGWSTR